MWNSVNPVYGAGIRTHKLHIASLIPWPLDHGYRPRLVFVNFFIDNEDTINIVKYLRANKGFF